jgi:hypothetical protein
MTERLGDRKTERKSNPPVSKIDFNVSIKTTLMSRQAERKRQTNKQTE